jgi:hypothetical protein
MKKTLLFAIICGAAIMTIVLAGCSKKGGGSVAATVKSVAGTYKLTASTVTSSGVTVDYMSQIPACEKDDILQLNADSTFAYTDAGTVCTPSGSYSGTWTISGNYFIQNGTDSATIKSFNGSALVLAVTDNSSGTAITNTTTLTKQ